VAAGRPHSRRAPDQLDHARLGSRSVGVVTAGVRVPEEACSAFGPVGARLTSLSDVRYVVPVNLGATEGLKSLHVIALGELCASPYGRPCMANFFCPKVTTESYERKQ
jgi:hypothetical protein